SLSVYTGDIKAPLHHLAAVRRAVAGRAVLEIAYVRLDGQATQRRIRPLQAEYWGQVWTCTAWCELREDFRVFRIDRIEACRQTGENFRSEPGKTYRDYLARFDRESSSGGLA
ncbi:MAG: helix-turn-helix transcriptional regulator, partial [Alphaproteobacteria bacterium]